CTISLIRRGGAPIETASLFCVIPDPPMKSSMWISPGWIGAILSVVVNNLHLLWSGGRPHQADPPLVVDPDAALTDTTTFERFEQVACRDPEVLNRLRRSHLTKLAPTPRPQSRRFRRYHHCDADAARIRVRQEASERR